MTTLTTQPVSTLIARLFADAAKVDAPLMASFAGKPAEERAAFMARSKADYRAFYGETKDLYLAISPATGTLLYILARATRARSVVEYGTSFGLSTLHLAAAVRDNGGGQVIGSEFEHGKVVRARASLGEAGLADLVDVREGDALETLARDLPASIDLVLLDGAKVLYPRILALLEPRLGKGAVIVADNADDSPEYLEKVRASGGGYVSVPFAEDVEVSVRV
jgi:predicted O-methyltransferase YrrM